MVQSEPMISCLKLKFKNPSYLENFSFAGYYLSFFFLGASWKFPRNNINTIQKMVGGSSMLGGNNTQKVIGIH
jgi:hypothetical protein